MLTKNQKQEAIKAVETNEKDTGSSPVQISILTKRITILNDHLKNNHKDTHSRTGLLKLIENRRKHLKYLKERNIDIYNTTIKTLGIRK